MYNKYDYIIQIIKTNNTKKIKNFHMIKIKIQKRGLTQKIILKIYNLKQIQNKKNLK